MFFGQGKAAERKTGAPGASGFGAPFHLAFSDHPLPGSGARQYSYDTLALPLTTVIGNGVANKMSFQATAGTAGYRQGIRLASLGSPGIPTGNIVTQPLLNTQDTEVGSLPNFPTFEAPGSYEIPAGRGR